MQAEGKAIGRKENAAISKGGEHGKIAALAEP